MALAKQKDKVLVEDQQTEGGRGGGGAGGEKGTHSKRRGREGKRPGGPFGKLMTRALLPEESNAPCCPIIIAATFESFGEADFAGSRRRAPKEKSSRAVLQAAMQGVVVDVLPLEARGQVEWLR